jgi:ubiquinol-cytochrome c reductase cytochrome b subunit
MRITKINPILGLLNDYLIDSPSPVNLSYFWSFGS